MPNRLAHETSPYLLQHAKNPVDWHPWDETSIGLARELDRPIFLSIGYSACHWCHVMEHESFENPAVAQLMNDWFVNIKVDREERPDLDQIYMNAVTAISGHGGWPMSVFLTPELKPFYGGTYWPPTSRWGRPGFSEILQAVHEAWSNQRANVLSQAAELTETVIQASTSLTEPTVLQEEILQNGLRSLLRSADHVHGGFGGAPKFPHPMDLRLALRLHHRFGADEALEVVTLSLDKMARGGIYDHLGGGFARYSTDDHWLVPHFEKMLYDNALLVPLYLEAHLVTGRRDFVNTARETLDYVLREMTAPAGGFFSTQDADSEGVEGKFFVWSQQEIEQLLGDNDAKLFCGCYGVTEAGNWEHANILHRVNTPGESAQLWKLPQLELEARLASGRQKLFAARSQRIWPGRDEKILTSWNGLMIAAFALGARILNDDRYSRAARNAVDFVWQNLQRDGRLMHGFKDGRARFPGYLDDYACLIEGLLELYQTRFEPDLIVKAEQLARTMVAHFQDATDGSFFYTATDHETLIARAKDYHDNATPSGNSMAATALLKLARLTGNREWESPAVRTLEVMSGLMTRIPLAAGQALCALDFWLADSPEEWVLIAGEDHHATEATLAFLRQQYRPNALLLLRPAALSDAEIPSALQPLFANRPAIHQQPTLYICKNGACDLPAVGIKEIQQRFAEC